MLLFSEFHKLKYTAVVSDGFAACTIDRKTFQPRYSNVSLVIL